MNAESAEKNLEVIRKLMERSSVYRLVASYSALIGGALSLGTGVYFFLKGDSHSPAQFFWSWVVMLCIVDGANTLFLYRDSKKRGDDFPSSRMFHAIGAMLPGVLVGGIVSIVCIFLYQDPVNASIFWALGCGLGLLGTSSFSPRSICLLGWFLLLAGLGYFCWHETIGRNSDLNHLSGAGLFMAMTFGIGLLVYGIATFRRKNS